MDVFSILGLNRVLTFSTSCGESMFASVAFLLENRFDAISLCLFLAQSLTNALKVSDKFALQCFQTLQQLPTMHTNNLVQFQLLLSRLGLPYAQTGIEGSEFFLLWISHTFDATIHVWQANPPQKANVFSHCHKSRKLINLICFKTKKGHCHNEPLQVTEQLLNDMNRSPTMPTEVMPKTCAVKNSNKSYSTCVKNTKVLK
jgi:hypothetical protein